jgi:crotonobetainyl-CoA:carnitine CoA-transferase CaiB-like acyl-CoA transferase
MSTPPLDGVLVADFSRVLAGPLCTQTLADLGDEIRRWLRGPDGSSSGA